MLIKIDWKTIGFVDKIELFVDIKTFYRMFMSVVLFMTAEITGWQ